MQDVQHGPQRLWYAPWRVICRCGYPDADCIIERTINAPMTADQLYDAGVEYARTWQLEERRRWRARGAR